MAIATPPSSTFSPTPITSPALARHEPRDALAPLAALEDARGAASLTPAPVAPSAALQQERSPDLLRPAAISRATSAVVSSTSRRTSVVQSHAEPAVLATASSRESMPVPLVALEDACVAASLAVDAVDARPQLVPLRTGDSPVTAAFSSGPSAAVSAAANAAPASTVMPVSLVALEDARDAAPRSAAMLEALREAAPNAQLSSGSSRASVHAEVRPVPIERSAAAAAVSAPETGASEPAVQPAQDTDPRSAALADTGDMSPMERVLAKASLGPRGGAQHGADAHQPPLPRAAAAAAGPAASPSAPADSTGIPTVSPPMQDRLSDCLSPRVNEIAESESESNLQSSLGREYCDMVPFATVRELDLIKNEKTIKSSVEAHLTELIMTPLTLAYKTYIAKPNADETAAGELFAAMSESVESEEELLRMSLPARVLFAHVVTKPTYGIDPH